MRAQKFIFKNVILFSLVVIFCTTHFLFAELCLLTHADSFIYVTVVGNIFKKSAGFLCILFKKILLTHCTANILYFLAPCLPIHLVSDSWDCSQVGALIRIRVKTYEFSWHSVVRYLVKKEKNSICNLKHVALR